MSVFPAVTASELTVAVQQAATQSVTNRGAVFTRLEVVDAILDMVGYDPAHDLRALRLLEPSMGEGEFLLPALDRLLDSYQRRGGTPASAAGELANSLFGVEIHADSLSTAIDRLVVRLVAWGMERTAAQRLARGWTLQADFLLTDIAATFDFVVGNPPYVRQERIPAVLLSEYRRRYATLYDRADLYVPFFERCLDLLAATGTLGFIAANRWMKNRYGGPLRGKVSADYQLVAFIDMEKSNPFYSEVMAYPAITILRRKERGSKNTTRWACHPEVSPSSMRRLSAAVRNGGPVSDRRIREVQVVGLGREPWLVEEPEVVAVLRALEEALPPLEEAHCKVGIGVATGLDRVFIGSLDALPVEEERKLPLLMAGDLQGGQLVWSGMGVINPYEPDGSLASLEAWPRFASYLEGHRDRIAARHVARKDPLRWYKTIDRVYPELARRPKLLIPDIKGTATVGFDEGRYYPHHNLYYITSDHWDLRALQTILRSSVAMLFVGSYSTAMSGGFLRFQAQYLRRIRLPIWDGVPAVLREQLIAVSQSDATEVLDEPVLALYGLRGQEATRVVDFAKAKRVRSGKE